MPAKDRRLALLPAASRGEWRAHRRHYIGWIEAAKKQETRARRLAEAVALLAENRKLGLK